MANEKSLRESVLAASPFLIKILELVLAIFCLCLIVPPFSNKVQPNTTRAGFIYSAITGSILINVLIVVSHFLGERIPKKPCLIVSCFYGLLLLIVGGMIIHDWKNASSFNFVKQTSSFPAKYHLVMLLSSGIFSILTSFSFVADVALTFKYG